MNLAKARKNFTWHVCRHLTVQNAKPHPPQSRSTPATALSKFTNANGTQQLESDGVNPIWPIPRNLGL